MYKPEPPTFNSQPRKCEKDGCPLVAEYESLTVEKKRHFNCEQHWRELVKKAQFVTWKRI